MDARSIVGRWRCGAAVAVAAALIAGCGAGPRDGGARAVALAPADRLDLGVVGIAARIGGDEERSAGAVIDADDGLVITTARSIWGATSLTVTTGLAVLHGRIVARDACDDLALIATEPRVPGLVALPRPDDTSRGMAGALTAVHRRPGLPSGGPDLVTLPVRVGRGERGRITGFDGALVPGAPLLGADGRLAGLVQVRERGGRRVATQLPWQRIGERLAELSPGGGALYVGWRRHYRCARSLERYTAARHPGFRSRDALLNAPVPASRLPGTAEVDR